MGDISVDLASIWRARNAAAQSLTLTEEEMQRAVESASVEDLVALIELFSPARTSGPEWTRTFEPLVERLWAWRDDATMAALAAAFLAKGMPWMAVANALASEHGAATRSSLRHPAWARLPAFGTA